jgi:transposase
MTPAKVVDHSLPTAADVATACEAFAVVVVTPTGHYRRRLFLSLHSATAAVQRAQVTGAMSSRAIAAVLGVSPTTVQRDLHTAGAGGFVVGLDGKIYRNRRLNQQDRESLISWCHQQRHEHSLSMPQIVAALADKGWRISIGTVAGYLKQWRCTDCSGAENASPERKGGAS